jgi:hypothetical protein
VKRGSTKYYYDDQVNEDEIAKEYGTNGRYQQSAQKFVGECGRRATIGINEILLKRNSDRVRRADWGQLYSCG